MPLVDGHKLGDKRLEVEDRLGAAEHAVLVERRVVQHLHLQHRRLVAQPAEQRARERLHEHVGRDAVREEVIELVAHLAELTRRLLAHALERDVVDVLLPVRLLDLLVWIEGVLRHLRSRREAGGGAAGL